MATVKPERVDTPLDGPGLTLYVWRGLAAGDTAVPVRAAGAAMIVQWTAGLFGGTTGLEGALDPNLDTAHYNTLNDEQGNALNGIIVSRIEAVLERCYFVRPIVNAGLNGVDVWLLLRR